MQLTPRYDGPALLTIDPAIGDPSAPMVRQRRRMVEALGLLDEAQWREPSRCEGWSVQDVVSHLVGTNRFWALSIRSGLAGEPTRFLATFDPVASPPQMVEPMRALPPAEVLEQFATSVEALATTVADLDAAQLETIAEAPPGHVSLTAVLLHALWDAWIHERDILLPLGAAQTLEVDEVTGCLAYSAGLGPAFAAMSGSTRTGTLVVDATDPAVVIVVEAGSTVHVGLATDGAAGPRLTGPAVDLVEALSFRGPFPEPLPEDHEWLVTGLGEVFDRV